MLRTASNRCASMASINSPGKGPCAVVPNVLPFITPGATCDLADLDRGEILVPRPSPGCLKTTWFTSMLRPMPMASVATIIHFAGLTHGDLCVAGARDRRLEPGAFFDAALARPIRKPCRRRIRQWRFCAASGLDWRRRRLSVDMRSRSSIRMSGTNARKIGPIVSEPRKAPLFRAFSRRSVKICPRSASAQS